MWSKPTAWNIGLMNASTCPAKIIKRDKKGTVRPYGFTDYKTIQDFPIRGRSVYLHVRRRKWIDRSTGEIFTYDFDGLTESGSKLSPEFVAFLKEED